MFSCRYLDITIGCVPSQMGLYNDNEVPFDRVLDESKQQSRHPKLLEDSFVCCVSISNLGKVKKRFSKTLYLVRSGPFVHTFSEI